MTLDASRKHDIKIIEKGLKSKDPNERMVAKNAGDKIKAERYDGKIRALRKDMIERTRRGENHNANDVREFIQKHESRGFGPTSFTFNVSQERWDQIFGKK